MLLKKVITPLISGIAYMGCIYAGGVEQQYIPLITKCQGFYIEGNVGYAYHPWQNDRTTTVGLENQLGILTNLSNINGGATGGADIGYQFARYVAVEGGWYYIPRASYNRTRTVQLPVAATTFTLPQGVQVNINSGLGYLAFKGLIPIYHGFNAFAKLGAAYAYNHTNINVPASLVTSSTVITVNHSNFWNPLLGFGLQYSTISNWLFNVQYDYVAGYHGASANRFITPSIQLVTFGLGYEWLV